MRLAILLLAVLALSALAAESKNDRDVAECRKAPPLVQNPADVMKKAKAKEDGFNACMAARAHPGSKPRAK